MRADHRAGSRKRGGIRFPAEHANHISHASIRHRLMVSLPGIFCPGDMFLVDETADFRSSIGS